MNNKININAETYYLRKTDLRLKMLSLLEGNNSIPPVIIEEKILDYIEYDEPQLAYSSLVSLLVEANQPITDEQFTKIIELGKGLDITNGIIWDEERAHMWWKKLKCLVSD